MSGLQLGGESPHFDPKALEVESLLSVSDDCLREDLGIIHVSFA